MRLKARRLFECRRPGSYSLGKRLRRLHDRKIQILFFDHVDEAALILARMATNGEGVSTVRVGRIYD
jgi:hypothetical protein